MSKPSLQKNKEMTEMVKQIEQQLEQARILYRIHVTNNARMIPQIKLLSFL